MKKKFCLPLIVSILLLVFGWQIIRQQKIRLARKNEIAEAETGEVKLVLDFGEGKVTTYTLEFCFPCGELTVFDLLQQITKENKLALTKEKSDFGVMVKKIGDKENSQDHFWLYYVNDTMAEVGADQYQLKDNDLVEWKYEKLQ